jgi:hypothetical protein
VITNKHRFFYLLSSVFALSAGVFCYYFFRDFNMIFFKIFKINVMYSNMRSFSNNFLIYFLKYNLCDGLWLISGILFLRFLWFNNPGIGGYYVKFFIGIALLLELLQLIKPFPGTFDILDLFTMAFFALSEQLINYFTIQRRQK